jgi:hypothetical protein
MKKNIKTISIFFTTAFFLFSCGGDATKDETSTIVEEVIDETLEEEESFYLPSALQVGSVFQRSGLKYADGVINPPNNVENYLSKNAKLLNFGVYSADLAYCVLNNQYQPATNILKSIKMLAEDIGMESIFSSKDLIDKFDRNIGNQDSIISVMVDIQERTDMFIEDNQMQHLATIIFAGAWIEGMYIGVKATSGEEKTKITGRLIEQMVILENLIKAIKATKNNSKEIHDILDGLGKIHESYVALDLVGKNPKNVEVSYLDLKEIANKIVEMRQMIIKLSA